MLENKYLKTMEILQELGKINIDFIENLDQTITDLKKLGYITYIENDNLILIGIEEV